MTWTGARIFWDCLAREAVEVVFGYPGGAVLPLYDAMVDSPIRHVLVRHEQGATHMADGYARATGRVGVALATSGPGATNMVTGIATAMMDSSPIVCITGQVNSQFLGTDAFQETDITGVTLPITKHNRLVTRAADIAPAIREAFAIARGGRPGPVHVDITKDAQVGTCAYDWDAAACPPDAPGRGDRPAAGDALALINAAERPVILAGHGILISGAEAELRDFAERARIPVALTLLGIGALPASHPLCLGMMGMHGQTWVNTAIQEADLLIAVGMRFDDRVTGNLASYAPLARKIHVDIDPTEFNKNVPVDATVAGDARGVLERWLPQVCRSDRSGWLDRLGRLRARSEADDLETASGDGRLHAAQVMVELSRLTDSGAIIVTDVGQHQMWEAQYYKHETPRSLITSGGLGTMGFALPAAIGAKIGRPEAEVWVVAGDGGFQMTMPELATLVQEELDIKIAVINNGFLGMVRQWQQFFYERRYSATPITGPSLVKLADAFGLWGTTVTRRSEIAGAVAAARRQRGALIDFRVVQEDSVYPMVPAGAALDGMIRRPGAVETAAD